MDFLQMCLGVLCFSLGIFLLISNFLVKRKYIAWIIMLIGLLMTLTMQTPLS